MLNIPVWLLEKKKPSNVAKEPHKVYGQGVTLFCLI